MGYKDLDQKRKYQREWVAARRAKWFSEKRCARCDIDENLELDHLDPAYKVSHRIWSWSWQRIEQEVAKCQVLCIPCHVIKTTQNRDSGFLSGSSNLFSKLTEEDVVSIRGMWNDGIKGTEIAKTFSVHKNTIYDVVHKNWTHVSSEIGVMAA